MEKEKLNILIVHNYYKLPGGEGIVVENEKKLLEENGHKVFLYTRNNDEIDKYSLIRKIILPINYLFNIKTYLDIKKLIKKNNIDIIHVHNTINIISKSVYYAAIKLNVPIVQTIHNFRFICPNGLLFKQGKICEECISGGLICAIKHKCYRNSLLETILSVINMKQMRNSKLFNNMNFICLTEFNKNKLLEINKANKKTLIKESQIYIKPNFVFNNVINNNNKREDYYVYASRLDENKGVKFLFQAWKKNEKLVLYVCGTGELENWCKEFIINNHIKNIILKGNVEHHELLILISKSKGLIYPTKLYEGMPMSIIESFSMSTPVITVDFGNAGSLVDNGKTGYKYKYNDINSFIDSLKKINNNDLYTNAYNEYQTKYSQKINYDLLLSIYEKVIRKNRQ